MCLHRLLLKLGSAILLWKTTDYDDLCEDTQRDFLFSIFFLVLLAFRTIVVLCLAVLSDLWIPTRCSELREREREAIRACSERSERITAAAGAARLILLTWFQSPSQRFAGIRSNATL